MIAARAGNAAGIVGVAPAAQLAALRACWPSAPDALDASCNTLTLAKAIDTAIRLKVRVLNLSLTGPRDALLETLLETALAQGMLVVGAMPTQGEAGDAFPTAVRGHHPRRCGGPCQRRQYRDGTGQRSLHDLAP